MLRCSRSALLGGHIILLYVSDRAWPASAHQHEHLQQGTLAATVYCVLASLVPSSLSLVFEHLPPVLCLVSAEGLLCIAQICWCPKRRQQEARGNARPGSPFCDDHPRRSICFWHETGDRISALDRRGTHCPVAQLVPSIAFGDRVDRILLASCSVAHPV